jgi:deoxyadenosine/deoxycytidine kinase
MVKPILLCIEGLIGAGKTTICNQLEKDISALPSTNNMQVKILKEPVDFWRELGLLDRFYKDQKRWAFTFQLTALVTKCMELMQLDEDTIYIIERSPYTDLNCFAKLCNMSGSIDDMEMNIYKLYFKHFITQLESKCAIRFIYLKTSPEICMERIKKRNRAEEKGIPIEYLISLEELHDDWLLNNSIILNGNTELSDKTNIAAINDFIKWQIISKNVNKI